MSYKPSISRIILAALLLCSSVLSTNAQTTGSTSDVPRTISYQGILSSNDGKPLLDGQYQITVALYSDEAGSAPVWQDTYTTSVNSGLFNLYLGSGNKPLPPSIVMNTPLWIGTSLNGESEMRPLTPLSASPYALNVPDGSITANKLADKSVTAAKLDADYVAGLQVNGEQVTGKGTVLNIQGTPSIPLSYDPVTQSLTIGKMNTARGENEKGASVLASPLAWDSNGDLTDGTTGGQPLAGGEWLGTSASGANAQYDLEFRVENERVMYYQTTGAGSMPNVIGGQGNTIGGTTASIIAQGTANTINAGNYHAISGGQNNTISPSGAAFDNAVIGGGQNNSVDAQLGTVGGGGDNRVTQPEATIAGGHNNSIDAYVGAITGGHDNSITAGGDAAFIGGGRNNMVSGNLGTIGGGGDNRVTQPEATIAGGHNNSIDAYVAGITSGHDNMITTGGQAAFIGAGRANVIDGASAAIAGGDNNNITSNADHSFIGGGDGNIINNGAAGLANYSAIAGGLGNRIEGQYGAIGGGQTNSIGNNSPWATVSGGNNNNIGANSFWATIGGGGGNTVSAPEVTIAGGHRNQVHAYVSTVGGGHDNYIWQNSTHATIAGGLLNSIGVSGGATAATQATIAGGQQNAIGVVGGGAANHSFIGGGQNNIIGNAAAGITSHSTISGGQSNRIESSNSVIAGGQDNRIGPNVSLATIGGGGQNIVTAREGTIAGGHINLVESYVSVIAGGHNGIITVNGAQSFIGGGRNNTIDAQYGVIGGGQDNRTNGSHTTIPGGDMLTTVPSYAQSAMGFFNAPRGSMPVRPTAAQVAASNDPLFMLGNGDINAAVPSNAFEVSYNGHSSVYGVNGSGTVNPSITGGTFVDNVLYAWADVPAAGGIGPVVPNSDFGVASIFSVGAGVYLVTITVTDQTTSVPVTLTNASITATIVDNKGDFGCATITTSQMGFPGPNQFYIRTYRTNDCKPVDLPFMVKVTGRP